MSKATRLTIAQWTTIRSRIKEEHGLGTVLVRSHMKEVMGFTHREHVYWTNRGTGNRRAHQVTEIHLDWYNPAQHTMFLLKYGDVLNNSIEHYSP